MSKAPKNLDKKRAEEKLLVSEMIALYCRKQHGTPKGSLCPECQQLHDYALARIDRCPFMETCAITVPGTGSWYWPISSHRRVEMVSPYRLSDPAKACAQSISPPQRSSYT